MNELQVYQPLPIGEIVEISRAFHASGFFKDATDLAKCIVKVQAGNEIGIPPFAAMTGIHIIQGKPTIGGGIIAAKIKASGKYDYEVVERNAEKCSIDFYQGKKKLGNETFTVADAVKAGTQNMAKYPKNMLFNRAISNGYKAYTPDIFLGPVYTPEEFDQVTEDTAASTTTAPAGTVGQQVAQMIEMAPIKPELNALHPDWPKAVEYIKGGGTIADLMVRYSISETTDKLLLSIMPANNLAGSAPKMQLTSSDPNYDNCVNFLKEGGKVHDLEVRYNISPDVKAKLLVDSSIQGQQPPEAPAFKPF